MSTTDSPPCLLTDDVIETWTIWLMSENMQNSKYMQCMYAKWKCWKICCPRRKIAINQFWFPIFVTIEFAIFWTRVTLIVGLPPRLTSFPILSSQISSQNFSNILHFPQVSSNFLSNSQFPPSRAGRLEQLEPPFFEQIFTIYYHCFMWRVFMRYQRDEIILRKGCVIFQIINLVNAWVRRSLGKAFLFFSCPHHRRRTKLLSELYH